MERRAGTCGAGLSLWDPPTRTALAYESIVLVNKGFAPGPVTMDGIESGMSERDPPTLASPALVAFVRAVGLRGGDIQTITLFDPQGSALARSQVPPLDRDKAQWMSFGGVRRPPDGFTPGLYRAVYRVEREGQPVLEQAFAIRLGR